MRKLARVVELLIAVMMVTAIARTVNAQDGAVQPITDDMVNAIAAKLYCPVCENITLDTCGTAACADWRAEIRIQLEQGMTEEQIIEDFVQRFGDRVVGTPLDPALRALSLVTPWILIVGALVTVGVVLTRRSSPKPPAAQPPQSEDSENRYQEMFEQDISGS